MSIQFNGRQYQRSDAAVYGMYKATEKAFEADGVRFMHVRGQLWLTAPDETTKREAQAFFAYLEGRKRLKDEWLAFYGEDYPRQGLYETLEAYDTEWRASRQEVKR